MWKRVTWKRQGIRAELPGSWLGDIVPTKKLCFKRAVEPLHNFFQRLFHVLVGLCLWKMMMENEIENTLYYRKKKVCWFLSVLDKESKAKPQSKRLSVHIIRVLLALRSQRELIDPNLLLNSVTEDALTTCLVDSGLEMHEVNKLYLISPILQVHQIGIPWHWNPAFLWWYRRCFPPESSPNCCFPWDSLLEKTRVLLCCCSTFPPCRVKLWMPSTTY